MKALLLFILLLCQLTTVNGQQTGCRIPVTLLSLDFGLSSTQTAQSSQPIAQGEKDTVVSSPLSVDYYINQINLADSLYKKYLPQYNYDEVKAAVEFFEKLRTLESENLRNVDNSTSQVLKFSDSQVLNIPTSQVLKFSDSQFLYQCARAHYYHAVGLTERDDIVGACEHYLKALEIMLEDETLAEMYGRASKGKSLKTKGRKSQVSQPIAQGSQPIAQGTEEYKKTRFMALIYTRLGRLFYNENYCDLSIQKYEKALRYIEILGDTIAKANVLKELGNTYQLSGNNDSALYYYNESLKTNSDVSNKLDVEKSIAMILFEKGERDSAYRIVKNNLDIIHNNNLKSSYYYVYGEMFYMDREYDSALYYLENSYFMSDVMTIKVSSSRILSVIYDSLSDITKHNYYLNFLSKYTTNKINSQVDKLKLINIYDNYKTKRNVIEETNVKKRFLLLGVTILLISFTTIVVIIHKNKKLTNDVYSKEKDIKEKETIITEIRTQFNKTKEELEKSRNPLKKDISTNTYYVAKDKIKLYYESDICVEIFNKIKSIDEKNLKYNELESLNEKELMMLLHSANDNLNNIIINLMDKYPDMDDIDLYCVCLSILKIDKTAIAALLKRDYKTIWRRLKTINQNIKNKYLRYLIFGNN